MWTFSYTRPFFGVMVTWWWACTHEFPLVLIKTKQNRGIATKAKQSPDTLISAGGRKMLYSFTVKSVGLWSYPQIKKTRFFTLSQSTKGQFQWYLALCIIWNRERTMAKFTQYKVLVSSAGPVNRSTVLVWFLLTDPFIKTPHWALASKLAQKT